MTTKTAERVHIFVEVSKTDHRKVQLDDDQVSGREIKQRAGVPIETDLAARRQGNLELVTDDEVITVKNGEHFVVLPLGTIS